MHKILMIIPSFLQNPAAFFQSVQRNEGLKPKALALFISSVVFLFIFGFVTGLSHSWLQALASAVKMPLLFLLTLAFTLPALYFFALALLGIQFSLKQAGVIVLSGIGVTAFLLLGLAPVTLFFVLTSTSYPFFQLLAVVFVALSGITGLYYLLWGFSWVEQEKDLTMGSLGRVLLGMWVMLYGFVGAQMTWRLSPLIGDPEIPFVLFRPSRDNFFIDVMRAWEQTLGFTRSGSGRGNFLDEVIIIGIVGLGALVIGWWFGKNLKKSRGGDDPNSAGRLTDRNLSNPDVSFETVVS